MAPVSRVYIELDRNRRMAASADLRRRLIATVQIARKTLQLDSDAYQAMLQRITGQQSCKACSDAQLQALVTEVKRLGFRPAPGKGAKPASQNSKVRLIWALWNELRPLLDYADDTTLRAFVRRQTKTEQLPDGVDAPSFLTDSQADRVIEGLKGWRANVQSNVQPGTAQ